jgi:CubicO group peptidase (beta-lactamase class C family)
MITMAGRKNVKPWFKYRFRNVVLGLLAIFLTSVGTISFLYTPTYLYREARWWHWEVSDYQTFPFLEISTAPPPFQFYRKLDSTLVASLFERNQEVGNFEKFLIDTDTTSFIVVQDDVVIYESYPKGNPYPDGYHSFSVAKSYISALVGIAIDEDRIASINDPITKYLPELKARDLRFQDITIANLLTMSSGLEYTCPLCEFGVAVPWGDNVKSLASPNLRSILLNETRITDAPGHHYLYKAYDPQLLSLILERVTGMTAATYLEKKVWKPLHMEYSATWLVDSEESGLVLGDIGINARPIDYAKFGRLFLNQGNWDGKQIISQEWVNKSSRPNAIGRAEGFYPEGSEIPALEATLFPLGEQHVYYGYLWWIASRGKNDYDFWALGRLGQWIYISPSKNLIIVRTGLNEGERVNINNSTWLRLFYKFASDWQLTHVH